MKKAELRQIIKEEVKTLLTEENKFVKLGGDNLYINWGDIVDGSSQENINIHTIETRIWDLYDDHDMYDQIIAYERKLVNELNEKAIEISEALRIWKEATKAKFLSSMNKAIDDIIAKNNQ